MEATSSQDHDLFHQRADHGAHVLIMEDESLACGLLQELLSGNGYQVTRVSTTETAHTALAQALPDLVILDLVLLGHAGLELCQFLRSLPEGEDIPVLIVTQEEHPESYANAMRAGADDFLRKPLCGRELRARTRSLIRLRQLRGELRQERNAILLLQAQKEALLQFVVHDLKNMLGTLMCGVELMEGVAATDWPRQQQRVKDTARTMQGMVQSLLDLSVHEQAGLVLHPERILLTPWLEQLHLEFEALILRRNQLLTCSVEPGLELEADPQLLHRTLLNLLENASKFSPAHALIEVKAKRKGSGIRIQVIDQGQGIPKEMKELIFNRFVHLDQHSGTHAGRGLGLAFCRLVVELHGGQIWAEPNPTGGSRFVMQLPHVPPEA